MEYIYIITGYSSTEWKNQTKERMPDCIQNRVLHRNDLLKSMVDEIALKKNVIIILDENNIAAYKKKLCMYYLENYHC